MSAEELELLVCACGLVAGELAELDDAGLCLDCAAYDEGELCVCVECEAVRVRFGA